MCKIVRCNTRGLKNMNEKEQIIVEYHTISGFSERCATIVSNIEGQQKKVEKLMTIIADYSRNGIYFGQASDGLIGYFTKMSDSLAKLNEYVTMCGEYITFCAEESEKEAQKLVDLLGNTDKVSIETY